MSRAENPEILGALIGALVKFEYEAQRRELAEGRSAIIEMGDEILILDPGSPRFPPEGGDVPLVRAVIAHRIEEHDGIHPDLAVRKFVERLMEKEGKKASKDEEPRIPFTRE